MPMWITGKLIGYLLAGLLTAGLLWKGYDLAADYFNGVNNTRTELSNERIKRERADMSLAILRNTVLMEDQHEIVIEQLIKQFDKDIEKLRLESEEQIAVLNDRARLKRVTDAKPKLIEKLANNATKERFDELENIFNN